MTPHAVRLATEAPKPPRAKPVSGAANPSTSLVRRVLVAAITGALPDEYRDEAVNLLTDALHTADEDIRGMAIIALHEIGGAAPMVLPTLTGALRDSYEMVRRRSARALGDLGVAALPALPHLIAALADPVECVRVEAIQALGRIGPDAQAAIPHLIAQLTDPELRVRTITAVALKRLGATVTPYLITLLTDPNVVLRERAAILLGRIGHADDAVVEALLETCGDREPDVRTAARDALERLHQRHA